MPQSRFTALLEQHDLPRSLIYLAPVLPIVQVMWADGRNQMPERAKIHLIMQNHCNTLRDLSGGMEVISAEDIERFDQAFIASEPDSEILKAFTESASEVLKNRGEEGSADHDSLYQRDRLFHACLEIAATCPAELKNCTGEMFAQRIVDEERRLIERVFELLPDSE